jgi:hypothetical protein
MMKANEEIKKLNEPVAVIAQTKQSKPRYFFSVLILIRDALQQHTPHWEQGLQWLCEIVGHFIGDSPPMPFLVADLSPRPDAFPPNQVANRIGIPFQMYAPDEKWIKSHVVNRMIVDIVTCDVEFHTHNTSCSITQFSSCTTIGSKVNHKIDIRPAKLTGLRLDNGSVLWSALNVGYTKPLLYDSITNNLKESNVSPNPFVMRHTDNTLYDDLKIVGQRITDTMHLGQPGPFQMNLIWSKFHLVLENSFMVYSNGYGTFYIEENVYDPISQL